MLTYGVTAALRDAPVKDVRTLLRERIMHPLGVGDAEWSCGYNQTVTVDRLPLVGSSGGAAFTPRALARVGRLILRQGDWDGKQLLSPKAVREITGDAGLPGHCGMGWWTNADHELHQGRLPAPAAHERPHSHSQSPPPAAPHSGSNDPSLIPTPRQTSSPKLRYRSNPLGGGAGILDYTARFAGP